MNSYQSGGEQESVKMYVMWGLEGVDRKGASMWNSEKYGSVEYDASFDLSSTVNQ